MSHNQNRGDKGSRGFRPQTGGFRFPKNGFGSPSGSKQRGKKKR